MIIGLHDAEKDHMKHKTFPNFALMKISAYYKARGDTVVWWKWDIKAPAVDKKQRTLTGETAINEFNRELSEYNSQFDNIYSSKVFDFTPTNEYLPLNTIKGGTGYGLYE